MKNRLAWFAGIAAVVLVAGPSTATTAASAPASYTARTADTDLTVTATLPTSVVIRYAGVGSVPVTLDYTTSGRSISRPYPERVYLKSPTAMSVSSATMTVESPTRSTGSVGIGPETAGAGTVDVYVSTRADVQFDAGPAAHDTFVLDYVKVGTLTVIRQSAISFRATYYDVNRTVGLGGDVSAVGMDTVPGAQVRLAFDPDGSEPRRDVRTVTTNADGWFLVNEPAPVAGTWTATVVATSSYTSSSANAKVVVS